MLTAQELPEEQPITAQHTPSVQKAPEGHVEASVQGSPSFEAGRAVQTFEVQVKPTAQSVEEVQLDLHAVVPHTYAPHDFETSLQVPEPSQKLACVSVPEEHEFELHVVDVGG